MHEFIVVMRTSDMMTDYEKECFCSNFAVSSNDMIQDKMQIGRL